MKPALLVIDVQRAFFGIDPVMTKSLYDAIRIINAAIEIFREKGLPVIAIQHINDENLKPGEQDFELPNSLDILPSDLHIHKTYRNAFNKTPLHERLKDLGVDTVIITGFCAEFCVLSTYRGAQDLDLTPIILRNATASDHLEHIKFVENISDLMTIGVMAHILP